jgi:predicted alpha/beta hydrolase family esterase
MTIQKKVLLIHGGNFFSNREEYVRDLETKEIQLERLKPYRDWKQNMQEVLGEAYEVYAPKMPMSDNAEYVLWKLWFERVMEVVEGPIILVGHSLGAMFLIKYFTENNIEYSVPALFLVAPEYLHTDDIVGGNQNFVVLGDMAQIAEKVGEVVFFHSKDDPVVLYESFEKFKRAIPKAEFQSFSDRGHFWDPSFPEIVAKIRNV